jgi:hypothetical protein
MLKLTQNDTDKNGAGIAENDAPPPVETLCRPVRSAKAARKYLARVLTAYQRGEITSENARTSVYVLSEFLRSTEIDEQEQRVRAIEKLISKNLKRQKGK